MQKYLSTTWRLWKLLKPFHKDFYIQLFLISCISVLDISLSIYIGKIVTASSTGVLSDIAKTVLFYSVILFSYWTFDFIKDFQYAMKVRRHVYQYLREHTLKRVLSLNIVQHQEQHSALKYDIVSTGEERTVTMVETLLLDIIPVIVLFIVAVISLANYSFLVAVFSTIACCLIFISETFFNKKMLPLFRKGRDMWLQQNKVSIEAFSHLSTVKSFAVESKFIKQFLSRREAAMIWNLEVDKTSEIYYGKRNYLIAFFNFIGLCVSVYLLIKGYVLVGAIFTIFSVNNNIFWQARNLQNYIRKIVSSYIDVQKYLDIIDKQPEFDENGKSKFVDGDITFENLTFKYPKGDSNVIENLSINIPQGKKVAFVGHSGSGKTTITRLLLRAYNYKDGSIKISGTELKDIDASSLRHAIGYVEQHVDLFDDTIKNNILFGVDEKEIKKWEKAKIVDAKLEEIAKLARIDEFYHRLGETKFETEIGERGIKLSGGERQRIGIARAIIKDPKVLVFDEATSALDTVNEKYIKEAIDNVSRGRTTIIIAHRLSTVQDSDIIFVMDKGRVVGQGAHEELMANCKEYVELVEHQELV